MEGWRSNNTTSHIIRYLINNDGKLTHPDQDAINYVCRGKKLILKPSYNVMSIFYTMRYSSIIGYFDVKDFYSKNDILYSIHNPIYIHYTGFTTARPWVKGCKHPKKRLYKHYLKKTPMKNEKDIRNTFSIREKISYWINRNVPYKMYRKIMTLKVNS